MRADEKELKHVYFHIPFCLKKCGFCNFFSSAEHDKQKIELYVDQMIKEFNLYKKIYPIVPQSIYFGGGTPSLLTNFQIESLLSLFTQIDNLCEITLEMNPGTVDREYIRKLKKTKVNRISLGAQSFRDEELEELGRIHTTEDTMKTWKNLREEGFDNLSLDIMYGLPSQTLSQVDYSLDEALRLKPEHISTYCLSLEGNVPMFSCKRKLPADEILSDFYYHIKHRLEAAGYQMYEIANFSRDSKNSRHNAAYWDLSPYLGLGAGAAGFLSRKRYKNPENFKEYALNVDSHRLLPESELLSDKDLRSEFIFLSLRKLAGMSIKEFESEFEIDFDREYSHILKKLIKQNLLDISGDYLKLTEKALFISNYVFSEFV